MLMITTTTIAAALVRNIYRVQKPTIQGSRLHHCCPFVPKETKWAPLLGIFRSIILVGNRLLLFIYHYSPVIIHSLLFIHYCSPVTIYDTVHSEFCLFKGGLSLKFKSGFLFQRFSFGEFSSWELFFERFPCFTLASTIILQSCN